MSDENPNTTRCRYCGKEISSETPFCWYCGRELETRPERPAEPSSTGAPAWIWWALLAVVVIIAVAVIVTKLL